MTVLVLVQPNYVVVQLVDALVFLYHVVVRRFNATAIMHLIHLKKMYLLFIYFD